MEQPTAQVPRDQTIALSSHHHLSTADMARLHHLLNPLTGFSHQVVESVHGGHLPSLSKVFRIPISPCRSTVTTWASQDPVQVIHHLPWVHQEPLWLATSLTINSSRIRTLTFMKWANRKLCLDKDTTERFPVPLILHKSADFHNLTLKTTPHHTTSATSLVALKTTNSQPKVLTDTGKTRGTPQNCTEVHLLTTMAVSIAGTGCRVRATEAMHKTTCTSGWRRSVCQ